MRILIFGRKNLLHKAGGDAVQIFKISEILEQAGYSTQIQTNITVDLTNFDLIHLFNINKIHEIYPFLMKPTENVPVLYTPYYQFLDEYNRLGRFGFDRKAARMLSIFSKNGQLYEDLNMILQIKSSPMRISNILIQKLTYKKIQKTALNNSTKVLFSSELEKKNVADKLYSGNRDLPFPSDIIPIGVEDSIANTSPDLFYKTVGLKNFILSVARIEPLKNQLYLMDALEDTSLDLVFIGEMNMNHKNYCKEFKRRIQKYQKFHYVETKDRNMIFSAFAAAKVHVLPSWFETAGLANLEAVLAGCNVVSTDRGYAKEYLTDFAEYCDPSDVATIRDSVLKAYEKPFKMELRDRILSHYTWKIIGPAIVKEYKKILKN